MTDTLTITSIPRPLTPLIGRDRELARLLDLIDGSDRLITLTGIGGIGKTRLAHQAALEIEPEFAGGAVIVPLADIRDASLVPAEIARRFGRSDPGIDTSSLPGILGIAPLLLVLDNLEQIPDVGEVIGDVLEKCPSITILATSQIPLDVTGEQLFPVEPMETGNAETGSLRESPAIQLFLHRAKQVDPLKGVDDTQLPLVAEICHLLDGIPLAIELAASRLSIFSLQELRERLTSTLTVLSRGRHASNERHRTMRNAIAWSYDLLDTDQQRIFRYLGVYSGGMSLDAINHTLSTLEISDDPLDMVSFLKERGLLRRVPGKTHQTRFQMLQTLREFACEQLSQEGDEFNARLAHATYVCSLAEEAEPHLQGALQDRWLNELQENANNIRSAAEWSTTHRPVMTLRIISAIWRGLDIHGHSEPFIKLGRKAAASIEDHEALRPGWLAIGSMEVRLRHNLDDAEMSLQKALDLAHASGDQAIESRARIGLGTVALHRHQFDTAEAWFAEAASIAKEIGDQLAYYPAKANIGLIAFFKKDYDHSLTQLQEALAIIERTGDKNAVAHMYGNLGLLHNRRDEPLLAQDYLKRAVSVARHINNVNILHHSLMTLGNTYIALKDYDAAAASFEEGAMVAQRTNRVVNEIEIRTAQGQIYTDKDDWLGAAQHFRETLALTSMEAAAPAIHTGAGVIMKICLQHGHREKAAGLAGAIFKDEQAAQTLSLYVSKPGLKFIESIPADPGHPERLAFDAGKEWPLEIVAQKAIQCAQLLIFTATGSTPTQPTLRRTAPLTPREQEVLTMMAKGHTNAEIAEEMFVSTRTVTTHASNIFNKMDVKNRSAAVALAHKQGLLNIS